MAVRDERGLWRPSCCLCGCQHTPSADQGGQLWAMPPPEQACRAVVVKLLFSGRSSCPPQLRAASRGPRHTQWMRLPRAASRLAEAKFRFSCGVSKAGGQQGRPHCRRRLSHLPPRSLPVRGQHPLQRPHDERLRGELQSHRPPDDQVSAAAAGRCGERRALPGPAAQLPPQPHAAESAGGTVAVPCARALGRAAPSVVMRSAN